MKTGRIRHVHRVRTLKGLWLAAALALCALPASAATWEMLGPYGCSVIGCATDPANPQHVRIMTAGSPQTYETSDGGATWSLRGALPDPSVWHFEASDFDTFTALSYNNLYRSIDGGANWTASALPLSAQGASALAVHPASSQTVYVASTNGTSLRISKTINAGATWGSSTYFSFQDLYIYDMVISRTNPQLMFICGYKEVGGSYLGALFKSSDGGTTWEDIGGVVDSTAWAWFYCIAVDPTDANRVYVGGYYLYTSSNGGGSWTQVTTDWFCPSKIALDPTDPSRMYMTGWWYSGTVYVGTNYGTTLTSYGGAFTGIPRAIHVASTAPGTVFIGTDLGLYKSSNYGTTWDPSHNGIASTRVSTIEVAPSAPDRVFADQGGRELLGSSDSGATWNGKPNLTIGGYLGALAVCPTDSSKLFALEGYNYSSLAGLYYSADNGDSWNLVDAYFKGGGLSGIRPQQRRGDVRGGPDERRQFCNLPVVRRRRLVVRSLDDRRRLLQRRRRCAVEFLRRLRGRLQRH